MSEVKPREWFIYLNGEEPCLAFEDIEWVKDRERIHKEDLIPVIEKSAYDKAIAELEAVKKERDEVLAKLNFSDKCLDAFVKLAKYNKEEIDALTCDRDEARKDYTKLQAKLKRGV